MGSLAARIFIGLLAPFLAVSTYIPHASAHTLSASNGVSAVLHIQPDDNAQPGKPTYMLFDFGASKDGFAVADCKCVLKVRSGVAKVADVTARPISDAPQRALLVVEFPAEGVYELGLEGYTDASRTERFRLEHSIRVTGDSSANVHNAAGVQVLMISLASLSIVGIIARMRISMGKKYARTSQQVTHKGKP